ncbi:hypothetical protein GF391_02520, partial [Candidatus Uhrbacteria bacterium]|nr:hypothetical protein [Candidatus Uhrbacteria bacterium]
MSDTQQAFQIIFDEGVTTFAAVDRQRDRTNIHCELTHLNPGANLSYMTETGERVSCSVISDATVVSIAKEAAADDAPLTLRVTLKKALKNDCSPLPQKGETLTLLPENGKSAIRTTCVATDDTEGTFAVTYRFPHIRQGAEAWLVAQDGNRSRVAIRDVDVHCFNSGINQSICVLHVSEAGKTDPLPEPVSRQDEEAGDKREEAPQDSGKSEDASVSCGNINTPPDTAPNNLGQMQGGSDDSSGGNQNFDSVMDGNTAIKPPLFSMSSRGKRAMQMVLACLATAVFVLILVPAGAGTAGKYTIPATTRVQSSVAASDSSAPPNTLASVMVWGAAERETIPMNHENLHKFFGQ